MPRVVMREEVQSRDFGRGGLHELWDLGTFITKITKKYPICCAKKILRAELGFWFQTSMNDI
jgi:hypothetical protein